MRGILALIACVVAVPACKTRRPAVVDAAAPSAAVATPSASVVPAPPKRAPTVIASDARGVAGHFVFIAEANASSWHVAAFDPSGTATTLGSETVSFDHAALAAGTDGALVAVTLLDDRVGGVFHFPTGGTPKKVLGGAAHPGMLTSVASGGDYVFAGAPLVRVQRSTGKVKSLGASDVVELTASDGTLYVAEQKTSAGALHWSLRSMPFAGQKLTEIAHGDGTVYGVAASGDLVAWSTMDSASLPPVETAKGSVWIRRGTSAPVRLATELAAPTGVALDATHVYVALRGGEGMATGSIARIALAGGAPEAIATELDSPVAVAVDDKRVYTIGSSRAQVSAPYAPAFTFITEPGDLLAFEKP